MNIEFTKVGCNPAASWWKQVWEDAFKMEPEWTDLVGLIGISECGTQVKFQIRGVKEFLVDIEHK